MITQINPIYKIKSVEPKDLLCRFKFHKYNKDEFVYRFPVYRYEGKPLIYCEFVIYEDDMQYIHINTYDLNGDYYAYNKEEYGKSLVVEIINERIQEQLNFFAQSGLLCDKEDNG